MWLDSFVEILKSAAQILIYLFLLAYLLICAALSIGLLGSVFIRAIKSVLVDKAVKMNAKEDERPISKKF